MSEPGRRAAEAGSPDAGPPPASRLLADLLDALRRSAAAGGATVLVHGPLSQPTLEALGGTGARIAALGDHVPALPLGHADATIDAVVAFDALDLLDAAAAGALVAEWTRVLREGGLVYLVARRDATVAPPLVQADLHPDATLALRPRAPHGGPTYARGNRELEDLLRPLAVQQAFLRRDGVREMAARKGKAAARAAESP